MKAAASFFLSCLASLALVVSACEHAHGGDHDHDHDHDHAAEVTAAPALDARPANVALPRDVQERGGVTVRTVALRRLHDSFVATGVLRPAAGAEALLSAPAGGRVLQVGERLPYVGRQVVAGEELLALAAHLNDDADPAALEMSLRQARLAYRQAARERRRLEGLLADGAVAARRVEEARSAEGIAQAALAAARGRQRQYRDARGQEGATARMAIRAPIAGTIVAVSVTVGALAAEGEPLLRVVDLDRLWLEVRVPESLHAEALAATGATFRLDGDERSHVIDEVPLAAGGRIDPRTRTLPLLFRLPADLRGLPEGLFARVRVRTGAPQEQLAIPRSAVLGEGPADLVFVAIDDVHFARRVVRLGTRDGDLVAVESGLAEGERVVATGAYLLKLAGAERGSVGHGHAH